MRGRAAVLFASLALAAGVARADTAVQGPLPDVAAGPGEESGEIEEPTFPRVVGSEALRFWLESRFLPSDDVGRADLSLVKPGARMRFRAPLGTRLSVQLTAGYAASLYDVDGAPQLFSGCPECPDPNDFHATSVGAQAALLLNQDWHLFRDDESWALLAEGFGRARWEPGAFQDSLTGGGALGFGYELPDRLRIALAVRVESRLDGSGVAVSPTGVFRWDITPDLRLRNRGLGLQLEYRGLHHIEFYASGFRASDQFRLKSRSDLPGDAIFRDRQWLVGAGVELKLVHWLRLLVEAGASVDRQISLRARGEGSLDSLSGDPSPYTELRLEIRP